MPYSRINAGLQTRLDPLAILNTLDITDKHQFINVAVVEFDGARHGIEEVSRGEPTLEYDWGRWRTTR